MKKLAAVTLGLTVLLVGCNQNNNQESSSDQGSKEQHADSTKQTQNNNKDKKLSNDEQSNNKQSNESQSSKQQSDKSQQSSKSQQDTTSEDYIAKVWLTGLPGYRNGKDTPFGDLKLENRDISGEAINPLLPEHSAKYPDGTKVITASANAAGHVIYKNNNDGTITMYFAPSHFQDLRWSEADYSEKETNNIINNAKTVKLYDASQSEIDKIKGNSQSEQSTNSDSDSDKSSTDSSDNHQSSKKITRSNVIDAVEDYEGHLLDTDKYTYKEPEQMGDGKWGFSYTDKNGDLAGSYIIDSDGNVTKYDEHGDEI
ncbi:hypothetical protein [Staphylococcus simiae]|uniref:Putative lipoprotein n=1 Tax=Staphylococcus simiae CCM 7213 = CCUG 51256 TaxID=911238 RepID=G5JIC5_9STAP|nr:hypothetical protein [Staphylococcus simiae]EHJ08082.1 putative lipoprotein [Staphylococcus simiae CCM 7213 = CCUG 51256]PNZ12012.1 hypothetical protein CD113_07645 [Staphylococcus simiae]SNV83085.1 lipoprotein [Staphylococcus simiae]